MEQHGTQDYANGSSKTSKEEGSEAADCALRDINTTSVRGDDVSALAW